MEIIEHLPRPKIEAVIDFASYLKEREAEELMKMQMASDAYQEWISPKNDIYDEVLNDEV